MDDEIDLVVLGGGVGIFAAVRAAQLGLRVVLVENRRIGGVCMNWGGLATKTLTSTVELFKNLKKASNNGIQGSLFLDWTDMKRNKDNICSRMSKMPEFLLKKAGVRIVIGNGEVQSPTEVKITSADGEEIIKTRNILIATGSQPITIPGVELKDPILDSDQMLELETPPKSLLVVGGGVIGLEFATIFNLLNTKVTIVEMLPTLLPDEEPEVGEFLLRHLKKEGMEVFVNSKVTQVTQVNDGVNVRILTPTEETTKNVDKVLMAIGRKPNINRESLDVIGVKTTKKGIIVDEKTQTSAKTVWAAGDAVDPHLLANVAIREAKVAAANIAGDKARMEYDLIPRCVFTIPETAAVGLTEKQAKDKGLETKIVKINFSAQNFRAMASNKTEGFIKIVILEDGRILGATIVGASASDLISEFILAIKNKMTAEEMSDLVYVHPSFSEVLQVALEKILGKAMI
ncbi:MAG: dihydrolipoyl dehydrogenase [Candidatus Bathyarchaeota archaeon]|nr:MAG: dihydrolipoyl dehydrogenase [Candidatus Bathyarchaeota archaeon]